AARTWPVRRDRLQLTLSAGRPRSCWGRGTGGQPLPQVRGQPIGVQDVDPVQRAAASVDPSPLRAFLTREGASFRPPPSRPQRGDPGGFGDWRKRSHSNPAGGGALTVAPLAGGLPMEDGGSPESPAARTATEPNESLSSAHRHLSRRNGLSKLCQSRMGLSEDKWNSFCLSSLAAQSICTSKLHCLVPPEQTDLAGSLGSASCCSLLRGLSSGWSTPLFPTPVCNPNKAVFTVDAKTTEILVANDKACQLLGHSSHDLIGQKLTQFFLRPDSDVVKALSEEHMEADGRAAVVFGTVVDVVSRSGERIPVSVWMKKVKQEHSLCCVVVLEPVERVSAWVFPPRAP
ncbi:unnamed protein product, partial [Gulo gulo]